MADEVLDQSIGGGGVVVAKASRDYRWRRYVLVLVILGWGILSINDGFFRYARENAEFKTKYPMVARPQHTELDITLNKIFGVTMPPLAVVFFCWVLYNSRGIYRYDAKTLEIPGHGPIAVSSIRKIDRGKWDRKGIAYVHYQVAGNARLGVARIDDFIYERKPTDEIFESLEVAILLQ